MNVSIIYYKTLEVIIKICQEKKSTFFIYNSFFHRLNDIITNKISIIL